MVNLYRWLKTVSLVAMEGGLGEARLRRGLQPPPEREAESPSLDLHWRELPGGGDSLEPDKELQVVALLTTALGKEQTGDRCDAILRHLLNVK